jgi:hypothetical protein
MTVLPVSHAVDLHCKEVQTVARIASSPHALLIVKASGLELAIYGHTSPYMVNGTARTQAAVHGPTVCVVYSVVKTPHSSLGR